MYIMYFSPKEWAKKLLRVLSPTAYPCGVPTLGHKVTSHIPYCLLILLIVPDGHCMWDYRVHDKLMIILITQTACLIISNSLNMQNLLVSYRSNSTE